MAARKLSVAGTLSDPIVRHAILNLDGVAWRLVYSFNAIAIAESFAGCNLLSGLENLGGLTAMQLRGLLYAALTPLRPDVTIEQAAAMIRLDTIGAVTEAIAEAYALSLPEKKKDPQTAAATAAES